MLTLKRMRIPRKLRQKRSFTLVELVFEITVLALLVIPTVILLGQLFLSIMETEKNSIATALAVQKAEEEIYSAFDDIVDSSGTFLAPFADYSYDVEVTCLSGIDPEVGAACNAQPPPNYKDVVVTVSKGASEIAEIDFLIPNLPELKYD